MTSAPPTDQVRLEIALYRTMARIRAFEASLLPQHEAGLLRGTAHPCTGMEAIPSGVCGALEAGDMVTSTHRGHGHSIAKGLSTDRMMAELFGRVDGYCRGRGGSMHVTSLADGMLGADGIVAGSVGIAVGAADTFRRRGGKQVVASFFGDGAANEGSLHEAMNLAAILKAPVVFVCENNQWAMSTSVKDSSSVERLSVRAASYGMPGETVDGNDALAVYRAARVAVERARAGAGPSFIEALTFRLGGHSANAQMIYASDEEVAAWRARDPLGVSRARLLAENPAIGAELDEIDAAAAAEIEAAIAFAAASPLPDADTVLNDVYSSSSILTGSFA